jgi:hypothetical protein
MCGIKGCKRVPYKGRLCLAHWKMVPENDRMRAWLDSVTAAHRIAAKSHARFLRELQARLRSEAVAARGEKVSR